MYKRQPEQCRGRDVDHRTDVYSFGVLAFELLTGQVPFAGDDYMEILLHHINDAPPRAGDLVADLSPTVDEALAWMMAKDPARRPPNLVTAVNALEHGDRDVALRTIKAIARRPWVGDRQLATWYEPFTLPEDIRAAISWVLGTFPSIAGLATAGETTLLDKAIAAEANRMDVVEGSAHLALVGDYETIFV